jgi:hypothetical protein
MNMDPGGRFGIVPSLLPSSVSPWARACRMPGCFTDHDDHINPNRPEKAKVQLASAGKNVGGWP